MMSPTSLIETEPNLHYRSFWKPWILVPVPLHFVVNQTSHYNVVSLCSLKISLIWLITYEDYYKLSIDQDFSLHSIEILREAYLDFHCRFACAEWSECVFSPFQDSILVYFGKTSICNCLLVPPLFLILVFYLFDECQSFSFARFCSKSL